MCGLRLGYFDCIRYSKYKNRWGYHIITKIVGIDETPANYLIAVYVYDKLY